MKLLTISEFAAKHDQPRSTVWRWVESDPPKLPVEWRKRMIPMIPEDAALPQKQKRSKQK